MRSNRTDLTRLALAIHAGYVDEYVVVMPRHSARSAKRHLLRHSPDLRVECRIIDPETAILEVRP